MSYISFLSAAMLATLVVGVPSDAEGQRRDRNSQRIERIHDDRDSDSDSDSDWDSDDDSDSDSDDRGRRSRKSKRGSNDRTCIDIDQDGRCDLGSSRAEERRRADERRRRDRTGGVILGRPDRLPRQADSRVQLSRVLQRLGLYNFFERGG